MGATHVIAALVVSVATSATIAALAGGGLLYDYWGYMWFKPPVPAEIREASRVVHVTPLKNTNDTPDCTLERDPEYSIQKGITFERSRAHLWDKREAAERMLVVLEDRSLSPAAATPDPALIPADLYRELREKGVVLPGDRGYERGRCVWGLAIEVADAGGRATLVVGLNGNEIANDHYPYYQATLSRPGAIWRVIGSQTIYSDLAGIEFLQPPVLSVVLFIPTFLIVAALVVVYCAVRYDTTSTAGRSEAATKAAAAR